MKENLALILIFTEVFDLLKRLIYEDELGVPVRVDCMLLESSFVLWILLDNLTKLFMFDPCEGIVLE